MTRSVIGIVTVVIVTCLGLPTLLLSAVFSDGARGCGFAVEPAEGFSGQPPGTQQWDAEQLQIASLIINRGVIKGINSWGQTIALAVAIQESRLRNLPHLGDRNDHDSIGVFQQRPSQGWATPEQLSHPAYQAYMFYDKLRAILGWETMPLTEAAQKVQVSAYPDAYAEWTDEAIHLVKQYGIGDITPDCSNLALGNAQPALRNPDGSWPDEGCTIRPDPTTGTGCATLRLLHLVEQATAAGFPEPACYRTSNHGEHQKGRACDWMMTTGAAASGAHKARGDAMAAWAVANADRLGIMYVIWFRRIWTSAEGWHAYTNPWGGDDPSGWHTNHVHISIY